MLENVFIQIRGQRLEAAVLTVRDAFSGGARAGRLFGRLSPCFDAFYLRCRVQHPRPPATVSSKTCKAEGNPNQLTEEVPQMGASCSLLLWQNHSFPANSEIYRESCPTQAKIQRKTKANEALTVLPGPNLNRDRNREGSGKHGRVMSQSTSQIQL
jgi:hypothetical protein